ncbi:vacuolar protein sorting-associated protein 26A [Citrus sinensis]|uniref:Vacuolar protein sorting-associated protein 26A n=2 Tax=Citrus sinensis TaxID=2711 RepID=A0ACB8M4A9_CITSI|nr:vacuolar protein sorting-associated protein 26A [Citrus sinensis]
MNYLIGAFKPACNISITFADGKNRKQVILKLMWLCLRTSIFACCMKSVKVLILICNVHSADGDECVAICVYTKVPLKKENGQTIMVPLFQSQENISGKISIEPVLGKKVEHNGVKIELLGQIVRELDVPGEIYERKTYPFEFSTVEMPYETYNGVNVRLRYVLKVTVSRGYGGSVVEYQDFVVRNYTPPPSINNSIKMEVGIEDCLHIEFEYNKSKYHLKDVIIGKIYFLLVRIKIKNMDLEIRRRESTGSGANTHVETETLAKFELMDGAPVRGESIPIRLFLSPYELTPTHRNINNKFSVKYYLNLVLVDEEDRRIVTVMRTTAVGKDLSLRFPCDYY